MTNSSVSTPGVSTHGPVVLEIPADHRYATVVRVTAAGLLGTIDPDVDEVDDLRLAVTELVGLLVEAAPEGARISVEMRLEGRAIFVRARTSPTAPAAEPDELARRVLDATVDSYGPMDGESFGLTKQLGERP